MDKLNIFDTSEFVGFKVLAKSANQNKFAMFTKKNIP